MPDKKYLLQRYLDKIATTEELVELANIMAEEGYPYEEELFLELVETLQQEKTIPEADRMHASQLYFQRRDKKERAEEIIPINRSNRIAWWTAAASLIVAAMAGVWMYSDYGKTVEMAVQNETTITISGKDYVHLPDGSTVTLNKNSTLTYTKFYGTNTRDVILTGEAYFDVVHDPAHPFKVRTGKVVTTVLGTAFVVNASSPAKITVTVTRGKVAVGDDRHTYGTITPNERIAVNTTTEEYVKTEIDSQSVMPWKNDYFILDKVTIAEAADLIGKRFNVKVTIANKSLTKCVLNAWFLNNETLQQVVEAVSAVQQAKYTIADDVVTIEGGKGCD